MPSALETAIQTHRAQLLAGDARAVGLTVDRFQQIRATLMDRLDELVKIATANGNLSGGELLKLERVVSLLDDIEAAIDALSSPTDRLIQSGQRQAAQLAVEHARALVVASGRASLITSFNRMNISAVQDLIGTLQDGSPLRSVLDSYGKKASKTIEDMLVDGLARGLNPTALAADLASAIEVTSFRLATLTRTAILTSYRTSSLRAYAESGVCKGWIWTAAKQTRSCLSCLALDGTFFDLKVQFFPTHPNCRCSPRPSLIGVDDPPIQTGEEWFESQSDAVKRKTMGSAAFDAYQQGEVTLQDFVGLRKDPRWGDAYYERSLRQARASKEVRRAA